LLHLRIIATFLAAIIDDPRPVKAVVLVFPYGEARDRRRAEDERVAKEGGPNVNETVFWAKQTVRDLSRFCSEKSMTTEDSRSQELAERWR